MVDFANTFNVTTPLGTDSPTQGDDKMRETKAAIQQRLDIDHIWSLVGSSTVDAGAVPPSSSTQTGFHRKVSFSVAISDPTMITDVSYLYTKDVLSEPHLHWKDESGDVKQITKADGKLNIVIGDLDTTGLLDGSSLEYDSGGIRVKAGDSSNGITGTMLHDNVPDGSTIELAGNQLAIKIPDAVTSGVSNKSPVMATGRYTGSAGTVTVDVGFVIRHIVIRNVDTAAKNPVEAIKDATGLMIWDQAGNNVSSETDAGINFVGNTFVVNSGHTPFGDNVNLDGDVHVFQAMGERVTP